MVLVLQAAPWALAIATLLWAHSLRSKNASHVDILWPLHHLLVCVSLGLAMPQLSLRATVLIFLVTAWAVRLATHLSVRSAGRGEDRRYAEIRANQGPKFKFISLPVIYLLQALLALVISAAFVPIIESRSAWGPLDTALFALMLFGLFYEVVADLQLSAFLQQQRERRQDGGRVLNTGLWALSRHPNYFGEWCFWLGASLLCLHAGSWLGLLSIGIVSWLLLRFSGVQRMESMAPIRRPGYKSYQQLTPSFFPIFLNPVHLMQRLKGKSTRNFLVFLFCTPLLFSNQPSLAIPAASEHWHFKAFIDDREVGYHSFDVTRADGTIHLSSRANFAYRIWRVPIFSYTHEVEERYDENLCLQFIESTTQTRSEKIGLNGERTERGFAVTIIDGRKTTDFNVDCLQTFAYWSPKLLKQTQLLNGQDGRLMPIRISALTINEDDNSDQESYRLQADSLDLTLHYTKEGQWLGLESILPAGRRLTYKLEAYRSADTR